MTVFREVKIKKSLHLDTVGCKNCASSFSGDNGKKIKSTYLKHFFLYIYPPDSQESDGNANTEGIKQLPQPACGDAKILLSVSN